MLRAGRGKIAALLGLTLAATLAAAALFVLLAPPPPESPVAPGEISVDEALSPPPAAPENIQPSLAETLKNMPAPEAAPDEAGDRLSAALAQFIRAEALTPEYQEQTLAWLKGLTPDSQAGENLVLGAEAFLAEDYKAAEVFFNAAWVLDENDVYLPSLLAATALGAGQTALAESRYLKALVMKSRQGLHGLELSSDQLGLALSLFMLGRPEEARPLAEHCRQSRSRALGLGHPDTLSAGNRLATIYLALGLKERAEALLKESYLAAAAETETSPPGLNETRLLLTLLMDQAGRHDELESFLSAAAPEEGQTEPVGAPAAAPAAPTTAALDHWRRTAAALADWNAPLAADLRRHILGTRLKTEKIAIEQPEARGDLLELIRAENSAGRFESAEAAGRRALALLAEDDFRGRADLGDLLAQGLMNQGKLDEAEAIWHQSVDLLDRRLMAAKEAGQPPDEPDAAGSLRLHLELARLFIRQERLPQEVEIELKSALARLDKKHLDSRPETAEIYLELARLMWRLGEAKNSLAYYRQAHSLALALADEDRRNGAAEIKLRKIAEAASGEMARLEAAKPPPSFETAPAPNTAAPPRPETLRLELDALNILGRLNEFEKRLSPALEEATRLYGAGDLRQMPYYGLKLKWLEDSGRVEELTTELLNQAFHPPGRNEAERLLNRCSALIYAGKINERAGRRNAAITLYQQALLSAEGRPEKAIAARRNLAETALKRLNAI